MRSRMWPAWAGFVAMFLPPTLSAQALSRPTTGPVIEAYGPVFGVPGPDVAVDADRACRAIFDVATSRDAAALLGGASPEAVAAQGRPRPRALNELTLTAEPLAAGLRYLRGDASGLRFGTAASAGPLQGVTLARGESGNLDEWATAHAVLGVPMSRRFTGLVQAGAVLALGDDFSALYPSAQGGVEWALHQFRLASSIHVMRIAGGDGKGNYRVQWVPLRIAWAFTRSGP